MVHVSEVNPGPGPQSCTGSVFGSWRSESSSGQRSNAGAAKMQFNKASSSQGRGSTRAGRGAGRQSTTSDSSIPGSGRVLRSLEAGQNVMNSWVNSDRRSSGYAYNSQNEARAEPNREMGSSLSGLCGEDDEDVNLKKVL